MASGVLCSHPRPQRCGSREPGTLCFAKVLGVSINSFFFKGFWLFVHSPPATEVWFRCAPPHVASLINGNGVVDRKLLMSGGAAAASSCEAGPLSPGVRTQK